jgi:phenylalanyl-tRNA synthetase beta chain
LYWRDDTDFREMRQVIIAVLGDRSGKKKERTREKGFLRLKGYVEILMELLEIKKYDIVSSESAPKGMARYILHANGETFGILDSLHEDALGGETFERPLFTANFMWPALKAAYIEKLAKKQFMAIPSFPSVERDLAFVLDESIAYRRMAEAIHEAGGPYLERISVFDIYRGANLGENKKNVAVNLKFRNPERTLVDAEVDAWMEAITALVGERTGGQIRNW